MSTEETVVDGARVVKTIIYQCDVCNKSPLEGIRYRCDFCPEFDLCVECKNEGKHDPTHNLQAFKIDALPQTLPRTSSTQTNTSTIITNPEVGLALLPAAGASSSTIATSRPPRRSANIIKSGVENAIERLDMMLGKNQLGPLPASSTSTVIAASILDLHDAGVAAMEKYKRARVLEQIIARTALVLANVPRRLRHGANFVERSIQEPVEQDLVMAAMVGFTAQLIALDSEKLLLQVSPGSDGKHMDLQQLKNNVEQAVYFRKVELPVLALTPFSRHLNRVFANALSNEVDEAYVTRLERLAQAGLKELKDALGAGSRSPRENEEEEESGNENGSKKKTPVILNPVAPSTGNASESKKKKRRRRDEEEIDESVVLGDSQRGTASSSEISALRGEVKRLREDLEDAHMRIDVLIHLLREKIANPLLRGLDRAGR